MTGTAVRLISVLHLVVDGIASVRARPPLPFPSLPLFFSAPIAEGTRSASAPLDLLPLLLFLFFFPRGVV